MDSHFWRRCCTWMVGEDTEPSHRMHHAFLILSAVFLLLSALFNELLSITQPRYNLMLLVLAAGVAVLWYRSRWQGDYRRMAVIFIQLLAFVILPLNWLYNAGSRGPAIMFYLVSLVYALILTRDIERHRWSIVVGLVIIPPLLLICEQLRPQWILGYTTPLSRLFDQVFCYLLSAALLGQIMLGHTLRIRQEQVRAETYARQLERLAARDSLTGLFNHRAIHQYAHDLIRQNAPCCVLICDLDHFKSINDRHGHPYGDQVLCAFAMFLEEIAGDCRGRAGRCGGEEFLGVIQGESDLAIRLDRQLRQRLQQADTPHAGLTFSAGLARVAEGESLADALKRADKALYCAKTQGRNRLYLACEDTDAAVECQSQ
ncbi:GGDEF domain-containing protein [Halomonas sp. WWR20]